MKQTLLPIIVFCLLTATVFSQTKEAQRIAGGFLVEVWIVPNGAETPKPTPTAEKMKYRKGRPKWFCTWCC